MYSTLLYNTDVEEARRLAETLRRTIGTLPLLPECPVTVSVGVAVLRPDEDWRTWMKRSDKNLYRAKTEGRNRVIG